MSIEEYDDREPNPEGTSLGARIGGAWIGFVSGTVIKTRRYKVVVDDRWVISTRDIQPEGEASRDLRDAIASAACEPLRAPEPRGKT